MSHSIPLWQTFRYATGDVGSGTGASAANSTDFQRQSKECNLSARIPAAVVLTGRDHSSFSNLHHWVHGVVPAVGVFWFLLHQIRASNPRRDTESGHGLGARD